MGSHTRNRRCGCDCRDDEQYDEEIQGESYPCCTTCDSTETPCRWIAKIDCSEITFAQCCQFTDGCVYTGIDIAYFENIGTMPESWCTWDYLLFTWYHLETDPCGGDIGIDWEWELNTDLRQVKRFEYNIGREIIKTATWEKTDSWNCTESNTLTLIDDGGFDGLPKYLCLVPSEEMQLNSCNDHHGDIPDSIDRVSCYANDNDRCTCCDACCDCFGVKVNGDCSGTPVTSSGQACVGGRTGLSDPAGVSREYCFNVNDGYGSHEICLVFYCNGTEWKLDVYCDGVFDSEGTVGEHLCCPLRFTFTFSVSCLECSFCGCVGEEDCDCDPPILTCCCPDDPAPETLTATITGCGCANGTHTMTYDAANDWWNIDLPGCGDPAFLRLSCTGDPCDWIYEINYDGSQQVSGIITGSCSPFSLSAPFSAATTNLPGCTGDITITA